MRSTCPAHLTLLHLIVVFILVIRFDTAQTLLSDSPPESGSPFKFGCSKTQRISEGLTINTTRLKQTALQLDKPLAIQSMKSQQRETSR
jgi:hypothetical protein